MKLISFGIQMNYNNSLESCLQYHGHVSEPEKQYINAEVGKQMTRMSCVKKLTVTDEKSRVHLFCLFFAELLFAVIRSALYQQNADSKTSSSQIIFI